MAAGVGLAQALNETAVAVESAAYQDLPPQRLQFIQADCYTVYMDIAAAFEKPRYELADIIHYSTPSATAARRFLAAT